MGKWQGAQEQKKSYTNAQENEGGFRLAAVSVLFDAQEADADLDPEKDAKIKAFLDELIKATKNPGAAGAGLPLAALMEALDWGNRYAYKGSLTTPPCDQYVYWNVIRRVYP